MKQTNFIKKTKNNKNNDILNLPLSHIKEACEAIAQHIGEKTVKNEQTQQIKIYPFSIELKKKLKKKKIKSTRHLKH